MDIADAFGRQIGLRHPPRRGSDCRLVFDGRTAVDIEAPGGPDGPVSLSATAGLLPPPDRRPATLEALLAASLFGRETGSAVLSIDADLGEIMLFRRREQHDLTAATLTAAIEDVAARASAWSDRLAWPTAAPTARSDAESGFHALRA